MNEHIEQTKSEVLDAAKQMIRTGLVAAVWGNVSARVPGTDLVVITPSGVEYETLTLEMLCVLDMGTGQMVEGTLKPSSESPLHLAVYRARGDVFGVMHTHSTYASAFSCARQEIPPLIEDLAQVCGGPVSVADYALPGSEDVGRNVVESLGTKGAVLMANHGVVGVGNTVSEALRVCQIVEKGAQICAIAKSIGEPVLLSDEDVTWLREKYTTVYGQQKER
ncbi:class II aldolase/adducin family protein [Tumebacillus sp. ITR2]|uniref:Class II aldolase/adducin family protein n=1 Tax=Tumebacillus amylolyticus TaxID=2801339 RepID=A0ABS1JE54_9BACL|nr:class II aldolase/adducin family protein [Tumebacillus amylolyticus]MBL0388577.1 class II aldolase/adducin family protein [Tumebacillus amylolyticus]